jgi:hypothetical protein
MKRATELFAKAGIDLSQARSTVINWPNQVVAIVDGYRGFRGVSHSVQSVKTKVINFNYLANLMGYEMARI